MDDHRACQALLRKVSRCWDGALVYNTNTTAVKTLPSAGDCLGVDGPRTGHALMHQQAPQRSQLPVLCTVPHAASVLPRWKFCDVHVALDPVFDPKHGADQRRASWHKVGWCMLASMPAGALPVACMLGPRRAAWLKAGPA